MCRTTSPFRASCALPRRQPAARYGSKLRRRDQKAAAYPHAESVLQLRTWSRAVAVGTPELSNRHRLAHRSGTPVASTAARRTRATAIAQKLRFKTRRAARGGRVPDAVPLGTWRSPRRRYELRCRLRLDGRSWLHRKVPQACARSRVVPAETKRPPAQPGPSRKCAARRPAWRQQTGAARAHEACRCAAGS